MDQVIKGGTEKEIQEEIALPKKVSKERQLQLELGIEVVNPPIKEKALYNERKRR